MSKPIEDDAMIGDRRSAALVARDGAIDWLRWPHFDSDGCFASLLGDARHECWSVAARELPQRTTRRYRGDTLILETRHETATGIARIVDLMPIGTRDRAIICQVSCRLPSIVPARLRAMYRCDAARHIAPHDVPWLPGWDGSAPVHIGNAAADSFSSTSTSKCLGAL